MSKNRDHNQDLIDFCNLWDQACEKGIFDDAPKPPKAELGDGLAAKLDLGEETFDQDDPYYNYVASQKEELLQEAKEKKITPNPIFPDSAGMDQTRPKPVWTEMKPLEKLAQLKDKLYRIECQLGEQDAGGKKWVGKATEKPGGEKLLKKIESLKNQIDDLSDIFGLEDEPKQSVWAIDRRK